MTRETAPVPNASAIVQPDVAGAAASFVRSGRVVPGLTVEPGGEVRSWWWPLPNAEDRAVLAGLVATNDVEGHSAAAAALAEEVDRQVRERLASSGVELIRPLPGRRTVAEAWLRSLTALDPWLPVATNVDRARALSAEVAAWVQAALIGIGSAGVSLRVVEPVDGKGSWSIEPLAHDVDEPSLVLPVLQAWEEGSPFGPEALQAVLAALGRAVRVAPELAPMLDQRVPGPAILDDGEVAVLLAERIGALQEVGVVVAVPAWWANRRPMGLRARASTKNVGAVTASGFGLEDIVAFTWEAALGDERLTKADLALLRKATDAKRSLVRLRGQWVEIRSAEVAALLADHGTTSATTVGAFLRSGLGLPSIEPPSGANVVGVIATGALGQFFDGALHQRTEPVASPDGFVGTLRPYQERGVGWLRFLGGLGLGACLADDMGLGKTPQLLATVLADPAGGPTLVVCPTSVIGNWEREAARFTPTLRVLIHHGTNRLRDPAVLARQCRAHDVVVTSYGLIARDLPGLNQVIWGRLALDEAQQVKNPYTAQAKAVHELRAGRRIAMTGTPVENRLTELWAIMQAVNPGLLGSVRSFKDRFATPIERDGDDDKARQLQRLVGPFVLRRLKTDKSIIDDLPDKVELTEHCPLTREQATLYQAVVDEMLAKAEAADGAERRGVVLAGIMKLKQVCNHPAHFLKDNSRLTGRSGKLIRVEELLDELLDAGDKALCFTQFTEWGALLVPYFERRFEVPVFWLHGGTTRRQRDQLVADFQGSHGPALFLLSLKAGGTGLNLTAASHVVHLDRWWNPAVEDQATDRAFRIGQHRNVLVHKLVSSGTVEERIDEMITRKRVLATKVVSEGERWLTQLSTDELRELLTYDPTTMGD